MLNQIIEKVTFFSILFLLDEKLFEKTREARCPHCGGPLHKAFYERNPAGGPPGLPSKYKIRMGLCCGREGCRRRKLPPSCLFMDRRGHWRCVILAYVCMRQNRVKPAEELSRMLNVHVRTLRRWLKYFREIYPVSKEWMSLRGYVSSRVLERDVPCGLLKLFIEESGDEEKGLRRCIEFLVTGRADLWDQA